MTNKLEISRELAERLLSCAWSVADPAMQELRALLAKADDADKVNNREMGLMQFVEKHAAPVVERQEPAHKCQKCYGLGLIPTRKAGEGETEYRARCKLYAEQVPPLIQTLHANGDRIAMEATIAQQAQRIKEQAQRIADLERGRGEPVGWRLVPTEPTDDMIKAGIDTPVADTGDDEIDQPQDYRNVYKAMINAVSEQPAPVAVVLPTILSAEQGPHYSDSRASELGYLAGYNACLDKVKELNQ